MRDFLIESSYKLAFFFNLGGVFTSTFTFYFMDKLVNLNNNPVLASYGGDYFSFVMIGIAFSSYLQVALHNFSQNIRDAQLIGTLEALLVTQTNITEIILLSSIYRFLATTLYTLLYLALASFFSPHNIFRGNILAALLILLLTVLIFVGLGLISACFTMIFKRGNPVNFFFVSGAMLVSGVYYPVEILPPYLQRLANFIPLTYSLRGLRLALLQNSSFGDLLPTLGMLGLFCLIIFPLGLLLFKNSVDFAKKDGSLTHY
jgi:ABC-2 type transport system permease protein